MDHNKILKYKKEYEFCEANYYTLKQLKFFHYNIYIDLVRSRPPLGFQPLPNWKAITLFKDGYIAATYLPGEFQQGNSCSVKRTHFNHPINFDDDI